MLKLMSLEWRKLNRLNIILEIAVYLIIMAILPIFLYKTLPVAYFGTTFAGFAKLVYLSSSMSFTLLGASLANHIIIQEYKNRTINLVNGYPVPKKKMMFAKLALIALIVVGSSLLSFMLVGAVTYVVDMVTPLFADPLNWSDAASYLYGTLVYSWAATAIGFIPVFYLCMILRSTVATVIVAMLVMQIQNFAYIMGMDQSQIMMILSAAGLASAAASILMFEKLGSA